MSRYKNSISNDQLTSEYNLKSSPEEHIPECRQNNVYELDVSAYDQQFGADEAIFPEIAEEQRSYSQAYEERTTN